MAIVEIFDKWESLQFNNSQIHLNANYSSKTLIVKKPITAPVIAKLAE